MIRVVVDDLAFVETDATVRPASTNLEPISSALRNIEKIAGPAFHKQLSVKEQFSVGAAVVTDAGDLPAAVVIHAVIQGPDEPVTRSGIRKTLVQVLQQVNAWQLAKIAIPPLGVGPGNLELDVVAQIMQEVICEHEILAQYPEEICIVVDSEDEKSVVDSIVTGSV